MAVLISLAIMAIMIGLYHHFGPHRRFRRYGVKHLTPVPLLGDLGRVIFGFQHFLDNADRLYKAFPGERFIGTTELVKPVIVIRDPELIKRVTVRDFDHFQDHGLTVDKTVDEVFGRNLFTMEAVMASTGVVNRNEPAVLAKETGMKQMAVLISLAIMAIMIGLYHHFGTHRRFRRYGVKHLTPVPLLGDLGRVIFGFQHFLDNADRLYKAFPGERFIGTTELVKPVIVIRDPELIKRVTVRDFDHFQDHGLTVDKTVDEVFGRNLFTMEGQVWKNMRSHVSALFTRSKLRAMFPYVVDAGNNVIRRVQSEINLSGENYVDMDIHDVATRFANDVFASVIYGIRMDSQNDRQSDFYAMAKSVAKLEYPEILKMLAYHSFPNIMKILKLTMFSKKSSQFFMDLLVQTLENCKNSDTYRRPEMMDAFLQAKMEWTNSELLGQIIGFLVAGVEVTAATIAFLCHMLAIHPHVQYKLMQEIKEFEGKSAGKLAYDHINEMSYLDMVVSENLRKWASSAAERVCVKDYNLGKPNDAATEDYIIRKGEVLRIYLRSTHHDSEYFSDPHTFDPERFSKENRSKIRSGTYNPFGAGPRICVGSRFALFELKVFTVHLLRHMEILPCEKTKRDIQLLPLSAVALGRGGHWVRLKLRN